MLRVKRVYCACKDFQDVEQRFQPAGEGPVGSSKQIRTVSPVNSAPTLPMWTSTTRSITTASALG